jgi:hypothetical protein
MVLPTFAKTKVGRLPGRNPATQKLTLTRELETESGNIAKKIFMRKVAPHFCKRHGFFAQGLRLHKPQLADKGFTSSVLLDLPDWRLAYSSIRSNSLSS